MFALKGGSSTNGSKGLGQYQSAINQAHQAVHTSGTNDAASGNDGTSGSASSTPASGGASAPKSTSPSAVASSSTTSSSAKPSSTSSHAAKKTVIHLTPKVATHNHAAMVRLSTVQHAIAQHKVVAMLFFNPRGADDVAVHSEMAGIASHHDKVVKLMVPLAEAANFTAVTQQVPVNFSPTLVLIAPSGQAERIVGYTDQFAIAERVTQALASK
jgi:hypothetical protein